MKTERCKKWDLPVDQCAHCRGSEKISVPVDWTTTNPTPLPRAVPAPEREPVHLLGHYRTSLLRELADLYVRLHENLPAESRGRSDDNAAAYAAAPDPRRAPVRIEVLDLLHRIEMELPDLARSVCDAMGLIRCLVFPHDSAAGSPEVSPKVAAALDTLDRHWTAFEEVLPEMCLQVTDWLTRLVCSARRMVGQTVPPRPLVTPCPSCGLPTIFRLETERGAIAVCGNPADRDEWDEQRQWTETEWEDAHPRFNRSPVVDSTHSRG